MAAAEIAVSVRAGAFTSLAFGQFWRDLSYSSLENVEAWTRDVLPWAWDPGLTTVLALPAWPLLLGCAAVLLYLFRNPAPSAARAPMIGTNRSRT